MPSRTQSAPRPYLVATERRRQLLDTAAGLVRRGGWSALSMQGVAGDAGVSRQLVYEHFASVDDLHRALLFHLFEPVYAATRSVVASERAMPGVLRAAYELFLDMPGNQQQALRALVMAHAPGQPALTRAKKMLRQRMAGLWVPYVRRATGQAEPAARALAWMLITAAMGLADMVADGTIARAAAVDLFAGFASRTLSTSRVLHATSSD